LAKLVGTNTTMANNANANTFLASLATENNTSKAQAQILLARKLAERERRLRKILNIKDRMRRLTGDLITEELNMGAIDEDVRRLMEATNMGVDEN